MNFIGVWLWTLYVILEVKSEEGWFWHVTDFHWDFTYWNGQLSCHGFDIPNPGKFGDYWCDSPWELVQGAVDGISQIKHDADFILWTGDTAPHVDASHLSEPTNEFLMKVITDMLKTKFPAIPVYATFGNNDYYRAHLFPPHGNLMYNNTWGMWRGWIGDPAQEPHFLAGGYYTTTTSTGIRIVALNTNLYYTKDTLTQGLSDPAGQFTWLDDVLTEAKTRNEKVIVTGHVPPGYTTPRAVTWMPEHFNRILSAIFLRHADTIVAMHFGHEHHDSFRLYHDTSGSPIISVFVAPSVTPWRYVRPTEIAPPHNPGIRLIKYDRRTGAHLDILQYYADLPESNANGVLHWKLGYSATSHYGIRDVSPRSLAKLVTTMADPASAEFLSYVNWYNTAADKDFPCNSSCHQTIMCGFHFLDNGSFEQCLKFGQICSVPSCNLVG